MDRIPKRALCSFQVLNWIGGICRCIPKNSLGNASNTASSCMVGGRQGTKALACSGGHGAALFCQTRPSCKAAVHSGFLAAARAGNLRLVRDDRGWTGWHVLEQTKPGTGSRKLEESMRYQSCRLSQDMAHVQGGDSDAWALVPTFYLSQCSLVRTRGCGLQRISRRQTDADLQSQKSHHMHRCT